MAIPLPDRLKDLLDGPTFAHLATVDDDGAPHVTTMWVGREGDRIIFNTAEGRKKWRNLKADPRVSVAVWDADHPYVTYTVQGRVVDITTEGADQVIDDLAHKYLGVDTYPFRKPEETRTTISVEALGIAGMG